MINKRYLKLLAREYPNAQAAASELINLKAILKLPKGTEYFFSDLHGEHEAFLYQMRSACGVVRKKIDELFEPSIDETGRAALARLVANPEKELCTVKHSGNATGSWYRIIIYRLVVIFRAASSNYTRSKVRKKLPPQYAYIMDELLHADNENDKPHYSSEIIRAIVGTGLSEEFIVALCGTIQQLLVDKLYIIGDIFDRGPRADAIMDALIERRDVDIQWGNHDISWMGAAAGNWACIANVVRLGISYNNFDLLEDGYGINLRALSSFAERTYRDDPCKVFFPHILDENQYDRVGFHLAAKMHKAMAVIQFKVEGQMIHKHPEYDMENRVLLEHVDFKNGTIELDGTVYPMCDPYFPTVDPSNPLALSTEETELMKTLDASFRHSERLQKHIRFLYSHGSMYLCINSNLLYHGCIPMTEDGQFETVKLSGVPHKGRAYLDTLDGIVRHAYFAPHDGKEQAQARDFLWYLWCGKKSPLFGKNKLATFERYFIENSAAHVEALNPYYTLIEKRETCQKILREFGMNPSSCRILNGHVPVRSGESPVKGKGLLYMIDGGISKAYQKQTGIGGYTFLVNSHYAALAEHKPMIDSRPVEDPPKVMVIESFREPITVADTDTGRELTCRIQELSALLEAYRNGTIKERN